MMRSALLLASSLTLLFSLALSAPLYHREGSLEAPIEPTEVHPWRLTAVAPLDARHSVILALAQQNLDQLKQLHADIHNPDHPSWLQHLTPQQIHDITALPTTTTDSIIAWLQSHNIAAEDITYPIASDTIRVTASVQSLNSVFNTTLHAFQHVTSGKTVYRQLGPSSLPDEFASSIEFVEGLHIFPLPAKHHGHIIEFDRNGAGKEAEKAPVDQARHTRHPNNSTTSGLGTVNQCSTPTNFIGIFPTNSLYAQYNMPDLSSSTLPRNPTTSTSTLQLWTADSNGNDQANSFSPSDLSAYSQLWSTSANSNALKVSPISGPNDATNPQDEPTLDTQSLGSFNPLAAQSFELTQDNEQFYGWATGFISRANIPQVVSISYGIPEAVFLYSNYQSQTLDGITLGVYLDRTNTEFMKISLRGTTILASSGDDGAAGANSQCSYTSAPSSVGGSKATNYYLYAEFPASSPYVTAVGATELQAPCASFPATLGTGSPMCSSATVGSLKSTYGVGFYATKVESTRGLRCFKAGSASGVTEQAVSVNTQSPSAGSTFESGGGFSRYFSRSSYTDFQSSAISAWQSGTSSKPPSQYYDATKRGIPDVSIFGSQFPLVLGKTLYLAAGTSLSSPLFAAVIGLLNNQTLAARGGTIGWANPLLYRLAAASSRAFTDITSGSNECPSDFSYDSDNPSTTGSACRRTTCQGFTATTGWDPVTGLGVPNVGAMQTALATLLTNSQVSTYTGTGNVSGITAYNSAQPAASGMGMTVIVAVIGLIMTALLTQSL